MEAALLQQFVALMLGLVEPIVAILVVSNVLPILPVVMQIAGEAPAEKRQRFLFKALTLGYGSALSFAALGGTLFAVMGIILEDLKIAGGLVLLAFAIHDLLFSREGRKEPLAGIDDDGPSITPLAVPLMVGPATIATSMILAESFGMVVTTIAIIINFGINLLILKGGAFITSKVDHGTMRAVGKVFSLILAALAVAMIRTAVLSLTGV